MTRLHISFQSRIVRVLRKLKQFSKALDYNFGGFGVLSDAHFEVKTAVTMHIFFHVEQFTALWCRAVVSF